MKRSKKKPPHTKRRAPQDIRAKHFALSQRDHEFRELPVQFFYSTSTVFFCPSLREVGAVFLLQFVHRTHLVKSKMRQKRKLVSTVLRSNNHVSDVKCRFVLYAEGVLFKHEPAKTKVGLARVHDPVVLGGTFHTHTHKFASHMIVCIGT